MIASLLALLLSLAIMDGDTFRLDGSTYRIANIDAPETRQAKCDAERRLGLIAKTRLDHLLRSGKVEIMIGDPDSGRSHDRHGRVLATVTVDGRDVGETLIAENLARPWTGRRLPWCDRLER